MVSANKFIKKNPPDVALLWAQGGVCFYCNKPLTKRDATRDHLVPRCRGGWLDFNKVMCCFRCNTKKGDRMPTEAELAKARDLYASLGCPRFAVGMGA